jgi:quercetin dioxygenase-like cupin family protein
VAFRSLPASDAHWRPSNQMGVANTDLGKQLEASALGARLWRLEPGQASTRHRHLGEEELYVLLEGRGRMRVDGELLTLGPLDAVLVEADSVRQLFNDTDSDQLWLVAGAPPEFGSSLELDDELLRRVYPDGPRALPPELGGGEAPLRETGA